MAVYKTYDFNILLFIALPPHSPESSELCDHKSVWYKVYGLCSIVLPPITTLLHSLLDTFTLLFGKSMNVAKYGYNSKTFRTLCSWLNK